MAFNSDMRKEKPDTKKPEEAGRDAKKEKKLDDALKQTFPASDPVAKEQIVTGSRARKPKLPE